jgi:hypothetical protein
MNIVAYYILSERSRLSEEDGLAVAFGVRMVCAKQREEGLLEALGGSSGQVPIFTSFPFDPAGDVVEQMHEYITVHGGGRYLEDKGRYEVFIVTSKDGNPPQPTCTAMIVDRGEQAREVVIPEEVQYCLDRGRRWEKLGRMGDAMHSYAVGRDVYGDHPELLLRLGIRRLEFETLLPGALECLRKAHAAFPKQASAIYPLALCYLKLAESEKIQVSDTSPRRLKELALSLLEESPRTSEDQRITALAKRLKTELGDDAESFFKHE